MNNEQNKLLLKIGKHFEANAIGNVAVGAVVFIVLVLIGVGFKFI